MKFKKKQLYRKLIMLAILAFLLLTLNFIGNNSRWVEQYYARGVYPVFAAILQRLFNLAPFSVGDLVYILLILILVVVAFAILKKLIRRQFYQAGVLSLNFVIGLLMVVVTFYLSWGMNYFRPPAADRLNFTDTTYTKDELLLVTDALIDSANEARRGVTPEVLQQEDEVILRASLQAVQRLAGTSDAFRTYQPRVKLSLISLPISYLGTAGYYNPFTAEAHINRKMPAWLKPLTACHEMAHQMGYSREDEANFVGFLAASASHAPLVKYSAYYMAVEEFMFEVMLRDTTAYQVFRKKIAPEVLGDFRADQQFWLNYRGPAGRLSSVFYDNYLKFNNQPEGLKTYNRMIKLTMAWFKSRGLRNEAGVVDRL